MNEGMTLIENRTLDYKVAHDKLTDAVRELQTRLDAMKRTALKSIKVQVAIAAERRAELHAELKAHQALFEKRKTRVLHGVRVGYRKQKGSVVIDDEAKTIALIRKLLPKDQVELLINVKESVHKPSVYDLVATDLKRLAIKIEKDTDEVLIKHADGDIDKLVDALLSGFDDEQEAAA